MCLKKRQYTLIFLSLIISSVLVLRIFYIAVIKNSYFKTKADAQNKISVNVTENRGNIYDRNRKSFTEVNPVKVGVVFSDKNKKNLNYTAKVVSDNSYESQKYIVDTLEKNEVCMVRLKPGYAGKLDTLSNVKVADVKLRYLEDYPASNTIGYVSQGKGVLGIEKLYDKYLTNKNKGKISASYDAKNNLIPRYKLDVSDFEVNKLSVVTTLDLDYSRICKEAFENANVKGAATLLSVDSFDILSLVSFPDFDPENVSLYLKSEDSNLLNRAINSYDMGSIFKIAVVCSALENGVVSLNDTFECSGKTVVAGKVFECHDKEGHDVQSLEQAFANSCNCAFIEIGQLVGYKNIIEMAKKFGMGQKLIYPYEFEQSPGTLPSPENYYLADEANLSIGQGYLSGNTVQGAVMSAIIAAGGSRKTTNLIDSIINDKGDKVENVRKYEKISVLKKETADTVKKMMIETVKSGTGINAEVEKFGCGGKTGTAQTGWFVNGENYQHGWFTGFFPEDNPKYALCVFVENGKSGSMAAAPIFKEIAQNIMKKTS